MNKPDPRDLEYLQKGLKSMSESLNANKFSTVLDIPTVHDRLYQLGLTRQRLQSDLRASYLRKLEPSVRGQRQSQDLTLARANLDGFSPN